MKKITAFVLSAVMVLSVIPFGVFAASGSGTETDPYQIATAADLIKMHEDLSAHYELVADIDMEGIDFEPIGNESEGSFTGSLDGKGHKISNLNLELPNNKFVGFIGCMEGGTVKNLNIENVSASGYRYVGGLVGYVGEGSCVENCSVSGTLVGTNTLLVSDINIGGIAGCCEKSTVFKCTNNAMVTSELLYGVKDATCVGGVIGVSTESKVSFCTNNGILSVSGTEIYYTECFVGGIVGIQNSGTMINNNNYSNISADVYASTSTCSAGIVAKSSGTVENCKNYSEVFSLCKNGLSYSAGIVGQLHDEGKVNECQNYGLILVESGTDYNHNGYGGGIAAKSYGTVNRCTNNGEVKSISNYYKSNAYLGGVVGINDYPGTVSECINNGLVQATQHVKVFNGGFSYASGIVCNNAGLVSCCINTAKVYSYGIESSTGSGTWLTSTGLVNENSGTILNCMVSGAVTSFQDSAGSTNVYGICGRNNGTIKNCQVYTRLIGDNTRVCGSLDRASALSSIYIIRELMDKTSLNDDGVNEIGYYGDRDVYDTFDYAATWYIDENINSGFPTLRNMPRHIDLNECVLLMKPGETATLKAYIDGQPENVTYESENTSIASVAADGTVKAIATGDIMISAKNAEGMRANCLVHITKDVSGISLNKSELSLESGKYETLSYTLNPQDANESVIWSSSNPEVASVDESGTVTANKIGSAVITVTTVTSGVQASCNVTVTGSPITDMYWYGSSINIYKNQPQKGNLQISPSNYSGVISYSSSDETVATVADDGTITGHKVGSAVITATSDNGKTANLTVYVKVHTESISLDRSAITLNVGSMDKITPAVLPIDSTEPCYYSSSDSYYVSVSTDGTITAKNVTYNPVKITVSSGYKEAYCFVTVKQAAVLPTEISLDKTRLNMTKSEVVQLTASVLPDNATDTSVKWTTSNKDIASVSQTGTVTAVGEGVAVIRAETANGFYCECVVSVISASGFAVVLDDARALPGDTVQIKANIAKNPGISAYKFTIHYDSSKMLPTAIHPNRDFGGTFEDNLSEQTGDQFNVLWYSAQDTDVNGELFTVDFSVSDTALLGDSTPVTLTYNPTDICNTNGDFLSLYTKNASVFIKEPLPGDVFEDDEVNVYDLTLMARYITLLESFTKRQLIAADVNNDDVVDIKDVVKTAQYLVGWNGAELLSDPEKNYYADIVVGTAVSRNGATAEIPVEIQNNPGISGFRYEIAYDSDKVEILDIIPNTDLLGDNFGTNLGAQNGNPLVVTWYQNSDMTENGTLFTVTARLKDASAATISIVPANNNMCDRNTDEIIGNYTDGYLLSDRYIADIHADGETISVDAYFDDSFQAVPAVAIIALYDQNGKLCGTFWRDLESVASQQIVFDVGNVEYAACDFMIWQSFTTLKPIVEKTHFER